MRPSRAGRPTDKASASCDTLTPKGEDAPALATAYGNTELELGHCQRVT
eukprot:SAG11_NODE_38408_length_252_cov_1.006536_1_plen_48_part_01